MADLTGSQTALLAALNEVKYLRLEPGSQHSLQDAEVLVTLKLARIDHKVFTGGRLTAGVVKALKTSTPTPKKNYDVYPNGTRVSVIRTEHGWHDGCLVGVIIGRNGDGYTVRDDDGTVWHTAKHRDVRPEK